MQYKFFRIPAVIPEEAEDDFNRFLRTNRVLNVNREFVNQGENSYWALAVEYLAGDKTPGEERKPRHRNRVDYRELLSSEDFALFVKLRDWRKSTADNEGVPVYTIFTNEQLATMVQLRISTLTKLTEIDGVGKGRLDKYGVAVIKIVTEGVNEKSGESVSPDC